jgi:TctA family transporter
MLSGEEAEAWAGIDGCFSCVSLCKYEILLCRQIYIHIFLVCLLLLVCMMMLLRKRNEEEDGRVRALLPFFCFSIFSLCFYTFPFPLNIL